MVLGEEVEDTRFVSKDTERGIHGSVPQTKSRRQNLTIRTFLSNTTMELLAFFMMAWKCLDATG